VGLAGLQHFICLFVGYHVVPFSRFGCCDAASGVLAVFWLRRAARSAGSALLFFRARVRRLVSQVGTTRVRLGLDGSLFLHHHMTKQKNSCTGIWSTCHVGGVRLLPWGCAAMPCALVGTSQPSSLAGINASLDVQCRTHIFSLMGHFVST